MPDCFEIVDKDWWAHSKYTGLYNIQEHNVIHEGGGERKGEGLQPTIWIRELKSTTLIELSQDGPDLQRRLLADFIEGVYVSESLATTARYSKMDDEKYDLQSYVIQE